MTSRTIHEYMCEKNKHSFYLACYSVRGHYPWNWSRKFVLGHRRVLFATLEGAAADPLVNRFACEAGHVTAFGADSILGPQLDLHKLPATRPETRPLDERRHTWKGHETLLSHKARICLFKMLGTQKIWLGRNSTRGTIKQVYTSCTETNSFYTAF